jgi:hypothetical protein
LNSGTPPYENAGVPLATGSAVMTESTGPFTNVGARYGLDTLRRLVLLLLDPMLTSLTAFVAIT